MSIVSAALAHRATALWPVISGAERRRILSTHMTLEKTDRDFLPETDASCAIRLGAEDASTSADSPKGVSAEVFFPAVSFGVGATSADDATAFSSELEQLASV